MTGDPQVDALLNVAKSCPPPPPSDALIARVLADAAAQHPAAAPQVRPSGLWARLFAPIGGFGGAVALASCAAFGVAIGVGYTDALFDLPGLDSVLTALVVDPDTTSPFESLYDLMSES